MKLLKQKNCAGLYLLEIKEQAEFIKTAAKENGVNEGDLFKALKEAGYNPKTEKGSTAPDGTDNNPRPPDPPDETDVIPARKKSPALRKKMEYPQYRRWF